MASSTKNKVGICADHGGFDLKEHLKEYLKDQGYAITDFGADKLDKEDDFPDFVIPLARAIKNNDIYRGIAICGSGVGACIAGNKVEDVRAALITEHFSAHQGVEDDDMNLLCLGGRITGTSSAEEIVSAFLKAEFIGAERHLRRLNKIRQLEKPH